MAKEESIHSLFKKCQSMEKTCHVLEQRITNLERNNQSKLKAIISHKQKMLSHDSPCQPNPRQRCPTEPPKDPPHQIRNIRQNIQQLYTLKANIAKSAKKQLKEHEFQIKEARMREKQNKVKNRNYQRLRQLQSKEKVDLFWTSKIQFHKNQNFKVREALKKNIQEQYLTMETLRLHQSDVAQQFQQTKLLCSNITKQTPRRQDKFKLISRTRGRFGTASSCMLSQCT